MLQLRGLVHTPVEAVIDQQLSRGRVPDIRPAGQCPDARAELDLVFIFCVGQQGCSRTASEQLLAIDRARAFRAEVYMEHAHSHVDGAFRGSNAQAVTIMACVPGLCQAPTRAPCGVFRTLDCQYGPQVFRQIQGTQGISGTHGRARSGSGSHHRSAPWPSAAVGSCVEGGVLTRGAHGFLPQQASTLCRRPSPFPARCDADLPQEHEQHKHLVLCQCHAIAM